MENQKNKKNPRKTKKSKSFGILDFWIFVFLVSPVVTCDLLNCFLLVSTGFRSAMKSKEKLSSMTSVRFDGIYNGKEAEVGHGGCVCLYIYICVCMYVCMYIYIYVCMYVYI